MSVLPWHWAQVSRSLWLFRGLTSRVGLDAQSVDQLCKVGGPAGQAVGQGVGALGVDNILQVGYASRWAVWAP